MHHIYYSPASYSVGPSDLPFNIGNDIEEDTDEALPVCDGE
jgi:hypothetical protein